MIVCLYKHNRSIIFNKQLIYFFFAIKNLSSYPYVYSLFPCTRKKFLLSENTLIAAKTI